jgi:hypothetical protein
LGKMLGTCAIGYTRFMSTDKVRLNAIKYTRFMSTDKVRLDAVGYTCYPSAKPYISIRAWHLLSSGCGDLRASSWLFCAI